MWTYPFPCKGSCASVKETVVPIPYLWTRRNPGQCSQDPSLSRPLYTLREGDYDLELVFSAYCVSIGSLSNRGSFRETDPVRCMFGDPCGMKSVREVSQFYERLKFLLTSDQCSFLQISHSYLRVEVVPKVLSFFFIINKIWGGPQSISFVFQLESRITSKEDPGSRKWTVRFRL